MTTDTNETALAIIEPPQEVQVLMDEAQKQGLQKTSVETATAGFMPFMRDMAALSEKAKGINFENPSEIDAKIAAELRKTYKKIRTGAEGHKDDVKKEHLLASNFIQSVFNMVKSGCSYHEDRLSKVEKFAELAEQKRREERKAERLEKLAAFEETGEHVDLLGMEDEVFERYIANIEIGYNQRKDEEKKAEAKRLKYAERTKALLAAGMHFDPVYRKFYTNSENLAPIDELSIQEMSDKDFNTVVTNVIGEVAKAKLEQEKKDAELEVLRQNEQKAEAAKELRRTRTANLTALGYNFDGTSFTYKALIITCEDLAALEDGEWSALFKNASEMMLKEKDAEKASQEKVDAEKELRNKIIRTRTARLVEIGAAYNGEVFCAGKHSVPALDIFALEAEDFDKACVLFQKHVDAMRYAVTMKEYRTQGPVKIDGMEVYQLYRQARLLSAGMTLQGEKFVNEFHSEFAKEIFALSTYEWEQFDLWMHQRAHLITSEEQSGKDKGEIQEVVNKMIKRQEQSKAEWNTDKGRARAMFSFIGKATGNLPQMETPLGKELFKHVRETLEGLQTLIREKGPKL